MTDMLEPTDIDYAGWAVELCTLLDAIELRCGEHEDDRLHEIQKLLASRFEIARKYGLEVQIGEPASGSVQ